MIYSEFRINLVESHAVSSRNGVNSCSLWNADRERGKIFDKPFIARRNLGKNFNKCPLFRYRRFTPGHLGELAFSLSRSIQYEYWMQGWEADRGLKVKNMELNPRVRGVQNVTLAGFETTLQFSMENFTGQLQKTPPI